MTKKHTLENSAAKLGRFWAQFNLEESGWTMTTITLEKHRLPDYQATVMFGLANVLDDEEPPLTDDELIQLAEADDSTNGHVTLSQLWEEHLSSSRVAIEGGRLENSVPDRE